MTLKRGYSPSVITFNIRRLIGEGYNRAQATAIAMTEARKSKRAEQAREERARVKQRARQQVIDGNTESV